MSSISRQYHPPSCSLEITAQLSPLSRWARRPMLKSVNFLLSFQELSGRNHEPLEIRGDRKQLQLLSETVANYTQSLLGQSLATSRWTSSAQVVSPSPNPISKNDAANHPVDSPTQPYLRPRSLVSHDLDLGSLSTNAEYQTVCLKASQLFDLVSALDDCAAELEVLPLPTRRPALPVWASSAAVIVLMVGVTTATLQLTQQNPVTQREKVTSTDQTDANDAAPAEVEGIASSPNTRSAPPRPTPSSQPSSPSPVATPSADANRSDLENSSEQQRTRPSVVASAPRQERLTPPVSSKPQAQENTQTLPPQPKAPPKDDKTLADQRPREQPVASDAPPADPKTPRAKISNSPPAAAPPPIVAAEPAPETTADTSAESTSQESDRFNGHRSANEPHRSHHQAGRQAPGNTESANVASRSAHALNIRQYISQRWQVPAGLAQPLQYQLTLNANGSLKHIKPLNKVATAYLGQVPFPAVNQPFIAALNSSQSPQVRLVLSPDGSVQTFVNGTADKTE